MKKIKKIVKMLALGALFLIILFVIIVAVGKLISSQKYKIHSEAGVQISDYVTIGGIEQYIQIRGQNTENPAIIVLHGGPGSNMAYYSYYWQTDLEENFTIVHWDQRGCGNTYYHNKGKAQKPTLDLLLSDLDELVDYVCTEYDQEKVIIMGHSWGTVLGGIYVGQHPEKVSQYVAVGQMVSAWDGEEKAVNEAIRLANEANEALVAEEIEAKFQQIKSAGNIDMTAFMNLRGVTGAYLPTGDNMSAMRQISMGLFSPNMTFNDLRWFLLPMTNFEKFMEPNSELCDTLFSESGLSMYDYTTCYEVPITFITGDCDWITPFVNVEEYMNVISAPQKKLIYIENAGHTPFLDKPEEFSDAVQRSLQQ